MWIAAPARLHVGLLNEAGLLGRVDGGLGLAVKEPSWVLEFEANATGIGGVDIPLEYRRDVERAMDAARRCRQLAPVRVTAHDVVPAHVGLGAKTSLLLACLRGLYESNGLVVESTEHVSELATLARRGGTSGVGVHAFGGGGVVWDCGHAFPTSKNTFCPSHSSKADPPALITRVTPEWLKIAHFRFAPQGVSGAREDEFFRRVCPTTEADAMTAIAAVALQVIPALLEGCDATLQLGLARVQQTGLKKEEWAVQDRTTKRFRRHWERSGICKALCLSSLGPTLFVASRDLRDVREIVNRFPVAPLHYIETALSSGAASIRHGQSWARRISIQSA